MKNMESSKFRLLTGYLAVFGSMVADGLSASCTQALRGVVPDFQLSVVRSMVQCIVFIIGGKLVGSDFEIKKENIPGLLNLGLACLLYNVGFYGATTYLPLVEVRGALIIAQIVTALLHSRLFFYIDIPKTKIMSLFVCSVGITLTAQPSWLFNQLTRNSDMAAPAFENVSYTHPVNTSSQYMNEVSQSQVMLGYALSVIGGAAMGSMYNINGISLKGIKPIVKATYATSFSTVGSVAFMFYLEDPVLMMDFTQVMLVLGHAVLSTATTFLFVHAGHCVPGPSLSMVSPFQLVMMLIFQYTLMHSIMPGNYNWIEVLGCMIIIFGASFPSLVEILEYKAEANELP